MQYIVARFAFRDFSYSSVIYLKFKGLIEIVIRFMSIHISLWLELPIFDPKNMIPFLSKKSGHYLIHIKGTLLLPNLVHTALPNYF